MYPSKILSIRLLNTALIALVSLGLLTACEPQAVTSNYNPPRSIVDLSPTLGEDAPILSIGRKFLHDFGMPETTVFHHITEEEPMYFADTKLELFNHVGPHHDAPNHMIKGARSTDSFGLEQFIGPAKVFDFRHKAKDTALARSDFEKLGIVAGDIVIAFVGYQAPTRAQS